MSITDDDLTDEETRALLFCADHREGITEAMLKDARAVVGRHRQEDGPPPRKFRLGCGGL
jgi:hypothetical protein